MAKNGIQMEFNKQFAIKIHQTARTLTPLVITTDDKEEEDTHSLLLTVHKIKPLHLSTYSSLSI